MSNDKISADELIAMKNKSPQEVLSSVEDKLSEEKKSEIFRILGDKQALAELLKSDKARAIMDQLSGKQ